MEFFRTRPSLTPPAITPEHELLVQKLLVQIKTYLAKDHELGSYAVNSSEFSQDETIQLNYNDGTTLHIIMRKAK